MWLVARRGWLAGKVIALPHHAAEAVAWAERFRALRRRDWSLAHEVCMTLTLCDSGFVVLVAVAVGDQQVGMSAEQIICRLAAGGHAQSGDLSSLVDVRRPH